MTGQTQKSEQRAQGEWEQQDNLVGIRNDLAPNQDKMDWIAHCNNEANARLIAASPKLYDFVKSLSEKGDADAAALISSI